MERGNLRVGDKGENTKRMNRKVQSTDTAIGAEWLVVVKTVSEKKTERRSHSIQAE